MTVNKFIKICSKEESPLGDFAKDIIQVEDFPFVESNKEVLALLESKAYQNGISDVFKKFKNEFEKSN